MNFFQQQQKARKQSRWLILAFIGITALIVLAIDTIVLVVMGVHQPIFSGGLNDNSPTLVSMLSVDAMRQNSGLLIASSGVTASIIVLASLFKIVSLSSGGAQVALDMGGTRVTADARDPLRRRLYNVVEEISIASGTPVPDVFVLESEPAINAFAAGYGAADAAVAVTQGTLEKLNRAELQGVIAHEFSHIFNGDMRINIRLMGILFGITVLAMMGRRFLQARRYSSRSSKNNGEAAIFIVALALIIIGYIGLFFARWIKSALSRQREYLADASAVQFTRDPSGIAGALKKIAAYGHASYLEKDAEEVSHMLFSSGLRSTLFATHPPLQTRIKRIEKRFDKGEIENLAQNLRRLEQREHQQAAEAERELEVKESRRPIGGILAAADIISHIGSPEPQRIAAAAVLSNSIDSALKRAAHSVEWCPELLLYCLLDNDTQIRDKQLLVVLQQMGDISESKLRHLLASNGTIAIDQRLPLMEIAFPNLKRRPRQDVEKLAQTVEAIVMVDNSVDSFEYLLSRLVRQYFNESDLPSRTRLHGRKKLTQCIDELTTLVSILASHGHNPGDHQSLQTSQRAFKAGMSSVGIEHRNLSFTENWQRSLDQALEKLDRLSATEKEKVVTAVATTALDDQKLITAEQEMMRVICALIHVPLPILQTAE